MAEYSIRFSENLAFVAQMVMDNGLQDSIQTHRIALYISLLSCEITLKALLERAEISVREIRHCSHDFNKLLALYRRCEIEKDIGNGLMKWVPATEIRSITVDQAYNNATIGRLLDDRNSGASSYPEQIRYGTRVIHYPPDLILQTAHKLVEWAKKYESCIRLSRRRC